MLTDKYTNRRYDVEDVTSVDTQVLEHIPYDYPGSATDVTYETQEFTSVCPWTGLPDFGRLVVTYRPGNRLVELKSFKYYIVSFRNVGIFQEPATARLFNDIQALLQPQWLCVTTVYNTRGGIDSTCVIDSEQQ